MCRIEKKAKIEPRAKTGKGPAALLSYVTTVQPMGVVLREGKTRADALNL
jgi:hypothetical protein